MIIRQITRLLRGKALISALLTTALLSFATSAFAQPVIPDTVVIDPFGGMSAFALVKTGLGEKMFTSADWGFRVPTDAKSPICAGDHFLTQTRFN